MGKRAPKSHSNFVSRKRKGRRREKISLVRSNRLGGEEGTTCEKEEALYSLVPHSPEGAGGGEKTPPPLAKAGRKGGKKQR